MPPTSTKFAVAQKVENQGSDQWIWSATIEAKADKKSLDEVSRVIYAWSDTSGEKSFETTDKQNHFLFKETSSVPLQLSITIELNNGKQVTLQHAFTFPARLIQINGQKLDTGVAGDGINDGVLELETSFLVGASTRSVAENHSVGLDNNRVVEFVFDDNTSWFSNVHTLEEVFPEAAGKSRSVGGAFEIPQTLRTVNTERGLISDVALKAINIFTKKTVHKKVGDFAADLERKLLENTSGLYRLDERFSFQPFERERTDKPYLLFIHGTNSSTSGSFGELQASDAWEFIHSAYKGRVLAFQHETLTKSPLQNVLELVKQLPDTATLHLVTHSRGGLVGDVLSRFCNANENLRGFDEKEKAYLRKTNRSKDLVDIAALETVFANKKISVAKFIRVACPANGTILASKRLDNFFNISLNLLGLGTGMGANPFYGAFKNLIGSVMDTKNDVDVLPGIEAMNPESPFIKVLNSPASSIVLDAPLVVISGNCRVKPNLKALLIIASRLFYFTDNDLVVNTRSMYQGSRREQLVQYLFDEAGEVDHFHYFKNARTTRALVEALKWDGVKQIPDFKTEEQVALIEAQRNALLGIEAGQVFTNTVTGKKPIVLLLPGIMGSNLGRGEELWWINYRKFIFGGLIELAVDKPAMEAKSLVRTSYKKLVQYLSPTYDVVTYPFDWRQGLDGLTGALNQKVQELMQYRQPIKIIGHSMGGVLVRDFVINHTGTWKALQQIKGSRIIFLGAPLGGSYRIPAVLFGQDSIINALAKIDITNTKKELLEVFSKMPGILSLLPHTKDADNDFTHLDTWKRMAEAYGADWPLPDKDSLAAFGTYRSKVEQGLEQFDYANMVYIAGRDKATPCGCRVNATPAGKELVFLATAEGDQSVTWESGIPKEMIKQNAVYYVNVPHGELADDRDIFGGIGDILENGSTNLLSRTRPVVRSEEKVFRAPEPQEFDLSAESVERTLLGHGTRERRMEKKVEVMPLQVSVRNGDLKYASYPVLAGHFDGDGILQAEKEIDKSLGGALSERHRMGLYPGPIGTSEVVIAGEDGTKGAIIVGLNRFGGLTAFQLMQTIEQGVTRYLLELNSKMSFKNQLARVQEEVGISTVLIGSGYGGLSIESSVRAIIQGVQNANSKVDKAGGGRSQLVKNIEFIELYEDRSLSCFYAINKMAKDPGQSLNLAMNGKGIQTHFGSKKRIPAEISEGWWQRITVQLNDKEAQTADGNNKEVRCLRFSSATGGAREEKQDLYISPAGLESMISESSLHNRWSETLAKTLFEMLIPLDFKEQLKKQCNINWILDKFTAAYPWELLQDKVADARPLSINGGMIRQMATPQYRRFITPVNRNHALVVGDPDLKGFVNQLPGAEKEGRLVSELLTNQGYTAKTIIRGSTTSILQALFSDEYKIIHLAGHGIFNEKEPMSSGMVIGKGDFLSTFHIVQMSTVPELVFVNCCYLGQVDGIAESLYSQRYKLAANIGTQLIENGVKAVVVAGWAVDDSAALEFTEVFYQQMFAGEAFGTAVQEARKRVYEKYSYTNTWGAYQAYGDPFYRFRSTAASKAKASEFVIAEEAEIALNNLYNELRTGRYSHQEHLERLQDISSAVDKADIRTAAITEWEGWIYAGLYSYEMAIQKFESLLNLESADYKISTLEKYCNVRMKKYVHDWMQHKSKPADIISKIDKVVADLEHLLYVGETSERLSYLGSAYKRKGMLSDARQKLEAYTAAANYYRKANALVKGQSIAYTLTNWYGLEGVLMLADTGRQWDSNIVVGQETYKLDPKDKAIQKLRALKDSVATGKREMNYWDLMVEANAQLCLLIIDPSAREKDKSWESLLELYQETWVKAGARSDKFAEIEHLDLLLDILSLSTGAESAALTKGIELVKKGLELNL